eukprot:scaffold140761_cov205-Phaeocystis_antarctica.AAC.1
MATGSLHLDCRLLTVPTCVPGPTAARRVFPTRRGGWQATAAVSSVRRPRRRRRRPARRHRPPLRRL